MFFPIIYFRQSGLQLGIVVLNETLDMFNKFFSSFSSDWFSVPVKGIFDFREIFSFKSFCNNSSRLFRVFSGFLESLNNFFYIVSIDNNRVPSKSSESILQLKKKEKKLNFLKKKHLNQ